MAERNRVSKQTYQRRWSLSLTPFTHTARVSNLLRVGPSYWKVIKKLVGRSQLLEAERNTALDQVRELKTMNYRLQQELIKFEEQQK